MPAETVRVALASGSMSRMGFGLTAAEIAAESEWVTGKPLAAVTAAKPGTCPDAGAEWGDPFAKPFWNGWGVTPTQQRFQPAAMAQLSADQVPHLKLKWAFAFP
jgi:polyvinyl alcohol dehydrogenase (cytochrome)